MNWSDYFIMSNLAPITIPNSKLATSVLVHAIQDYHRTFCRSTGYAGYWARNAKKISIKMLAEAPEASNSGPHVVVVIVKSA